MNLQPYRKASVLGAVLIETALALGTLLVVAFVCMKASVAVCYSQRWTIRQAMTDAFMTRVGHWQSLALRKNHPAIVSVANLSERDNDHPRNRKAPRGNPGHGHPEKNEDAESE